MITVSLVPSKVSSHGGDVEGMFIEWIEATDGLLMLEDY